MINQLDIKAHDSRDPNPWLALYLDNSIPMNNKTKEALMRNNNSRSAKYLLPLIQLWSKVTMFFIYIFKFFFPRFFNSSKILHRILSWGLRRFVSRDARSRAESAKRPVVSCASAKLARFVKSWG